ncbi:hypothetical protein R4J17_07275 [Brachyspira intermedia]|uniref:hypothetical protein n=1 Tax=Brachyspira intermedia TaxID=84377 RepID=UPI003005BB6C
MYKKIILLLISVLLLSCSSPYGQQGSMKFKDRKGTYQNKDANIVITVKDTDKQNLAINIYNVSGVGVISETYDIPSAVITGNFNLQSQLYPDYNYVLNFYGNNSVYFSVRKGTSYPINNQELNNSTKQ